MVDVPSPRTFLISTSFEILKLELLQMDIFQKTFSVKQVVLQI